jgi:hypothetical protein
MMRTLATPRLEALRQETFEIFHEATADRDAHLVRNVVLLGPQSKNGYRYSPEAMREAVPLYENRPIFLDHADEAGGPTRRKLRDFAGQVQGPRWEGERLRGDLRLLGPHTAWLFDLIEASPRDVGMSHVVLGRRGADGLCVEHIERVISVDIVAFPATTSSFREDAGVADWVKQLVDQPRLPAALRNEGLFQMVASHPEPGRLIAALEQFAESLQRDEPRSAGKPDAGETLSASLKQSVVRAVRGR